MKAIVIYPGLMSQFKQPDIFEFPIDSFVPLSGTDSTCLETIFRECNHINGMQWISNKQLRSMCIGDIVILDDKFYICEPLGWKPINVTPAPAI